MKKLLPFLFSLLVVGWGSLGIAQIAYAQSSDDGAEAVNTEQAMGDEGSVYIPGNLEECFIELRKQLPESELEQFRTGEEDTVTTRAHHGLGMWIRNNWGLWSGSRLAKYFNEMGIHHPDDMSSVILTSFHRQLNDQDIELEQQIRYYQEYWEKVQQEQARSAARAFCTEFGFPEGRMKELDGPPLSGPLSLERDGRQVVVYRWLGGGRGDYYVQVETDEDGGRVVVYGGYGHKEFGPWTFKGAAE